MSRPHIKAVCAPSAKPFLPPSLGQIRSSGPEVKDDCSFPSFPKAIHLSLIENTDLEVKPSVCPLAHPGPGVGSFFLDSEPYPAALLGWGQRRTRQLGRRKTLPPRASQPGDCSAAVNTALGWPNTMGIEMGTSREPKTIPASKEVA